MSTTYKYIIPIVSNSITLEDLSKDAGFIDVYDSDVNRPYLDNHIILLYNMDIANPISFERNKRLKNDKNLYYTTDIHINGKPYTIYVFCQNNTAHQIMDNHLIFNDSDKLRIMTFWKCSDVNINEYMVNPFNTDCKHRTNVLPEQDYTAPFTYKKSQGLSI